jgi:superfamily II DNA or RNA helicase
MRNQMKKKSNWQSLCLRALKVMDMSGLRGYQRTSVEHVMRSKSRSVCFVEPTGAGKTHQVIVMTKALVDVGAKVAFLARKEVLLADVYQRFKAAGIHVGIIQADRPEDPTARVQVGSLQTLHMRGVVPNGDVVFMDECHGAPAPQVRGLLEWYDGRVIGLTATPWRQDDAPLGDVFEEMIVGCTVRDLIEDKWLVPCIVRIPPPQLALDGTLIAHPVDAYQKWTPTRRAVVFAVGVKHAQEIAYAANQRGISAEVIVATTRASERRAIAERFRTGKTRMLCGVGVFKEGWDAPHADCIILARRMASMAEYLQACGRGLRPFKGKEDCEILDLHGSTMLCGGSPSRPRIWSLRGGGKVKPSSGDQEHVCTNPDCGTVFTGSNCPKCGTPHSLVVIPKDRNMADAMIPWSGETSEYLDTLTAFALRAHAKRQRMAHWKDWVIRQFERGVGYQIPEPILAQL